jgi:hypothetical protein
MRDYITVTCLECDHNHEVAMIRGEYPSDDYCECPTHCEACGAPFDGDWNMVDDGPQHERRQMGITD